MRHGDPLPSAGIGALLVVIGLAVSGVVLMSTM